MTPDLHTHIKHFLITVAIIAGCLIGLKMYANYQSHIAEVIAKRDEQIAANQATVKQSQGVIDTSGINTAKQLADLKDQLNRKLDSTQAKTLISGMLPGVAAVSTKDDKGNPFISIPDTQENRDKLNQANTDYKSCVFSRDDCMIARKQYETVIIPSKDSTIKLQADQITALKKYQVPKNMLFFGVGKTQGTNFQDVNSYQPVIGYGRRITNRVGFMGFVQNKSISIGATWNFGATK